MSGHRLTAAATTSRRRLRQLDCCAYVASLLYSFVSNPEREAGRLRSKLALALAGVVLAVGLVAYEWRRSDERPVEYVTAKVERGRIEVVVTATGTVNPVTTVEVGTYVSGPIKKIYADYNSVVSKGQLVAEIDPKPFQLRVQQAEAVLANARAQVERAAADLELKRVTLRRSRELRQKGLSPQSELDQAESEAKQAEAQLHLQEAQVLGAEAALAEAKVNLDYTRIVSPVDGVVIRRDVDVGQTVAASFQTPTLFLIAQDLTKMQVNANVSESDIGVMRDGQGARFSVDAFPDSTFDGVVLQVRNAPVIVQNVVTYDVVIGVDNGDLRLKPGMTAEVSIIVDARDDVLTLPSAALRFRLPGAKSSEKPVLWRRRDGKAPQPVAVQVGISDERRVEVAGDDLAEGDDIIVAIAGSPGSDEGPRVLGVPRFH